MALLPAPGEPDACYLLDLSDWTRGVFEVAGQPPIMNRVVVTAVVNKLVDLLTGQRPAFFAVAADTPGPVWQNEMWDGYKIDRSDPGPVYDAHVNMVIRVLLAHRIPVFRRPGNEADDLLATLARRVRCAKLRVVLMARDHDLWQSIDEAGETIAWDLRSTAVVGAAEVRTRYGVSPALLGDLMALAGDGSEAPGIEKIGAKTAARLLTKHGSLEAVLAAADSEKGALGQRLRDGAEIARLSKRLVTLRDDLPLPVSLAEMAVGWSSDDAKAIRRLGEELNVGILQKLSLAGFPKRAVSREAQHAVCVGEPMAAS